MKNTFIVSALATATAFAGTSGDFLETTGCPPDHDHSAHEHHHNNAPIGVMGSHTHAAGEWMASYRYMFMRMEQNYDGSSTVSDSSVLSDFVVTPQNMDMQMHMFGIMYAPTDKITIMGMLNLVEMTMDHRTRMGGAFTTESSGLGDSSFGALYQLFADDSQSVHIGLMALLPTADIDQRDATPLGPDSQLPYPMQLGSGSWGISPSITWTGHQDAWSYGAQASGKFYLADNENDYRLGNRYEGTLWGARQWSDSFSTSLRVSVSRWEDIDGADPSIATTPPMGPMAGVPLVPTADPELRAGTRIDLSAGANFRIPNTGATLAIEAGVPVYQDLDGPQLGVEWFATAGLQFAF
ncbi:MAG: transporter [Roseibacillus sp.]